MKVKILGTEGYRDRFGVVHYSGDVAELPEALALKLVKHGLAALVDGPPVEPKGSVTTAMLAPTETVMRKPGRPRKSE